MDTPGPSPAGSWRGTSPTSRPSWRCGCSRGGLAASTRSLASRHRTAMCHPRQEFTAMTCCFTWIDWRIGPRSRHARHARGRAGSPPLMMTTTAISLGPSPVSGREEWKMVRLMGDARHRGWRPLAIGEHHGRTIGATMTTMTATKVARGAPGKRHSWATPATPRACPQTSSRPRQDAAA